MRLLVDGDACPDKEEIKQLAIQYQKEMIVFVDYAHLLEDDYYQVIQCEIGRDSVDMKLLNYAQSGDVVITQDYGLASLLLSKHVRVLHVTGMIIDRQNIDELLMSRYVSYKHRQSHKHLKGPPKRTQEIKRYFLIQLENLLKDADIMG